MRPSHKLEHVSVSFDEKQRRKEPNGLAYQLEGRLLEVCNSNVLCSCWIGEDSNNGTCDAMVAYHVDEGTVDGVDVSGYTLASLIYIPGNVLQGNWKTVVFVDERQRTSSRKRS